MRTKTKENIKKILSKKRLIATEALVNELNDLLTEKGIKQYSQTTVVDGEECVINLGPIQDEYGLVVRRAHEFDIDTCTDKALIALYKKHQNKVTLYEKLNDAFDRGTKGFKHGGKKYSRFVSYSCGAKKCCGWDCEEIKYGVTKRSAKTYDDVDEFLCCYEDEWEDIVAEAESKNLKYDIIFSSFTFSKGVGYPNQLQSHHKEYCGLIFAQLTQCLITLDPTTYESLGQLRDNCIAACALGRTDMVVW